MGRCVIEMRDGTHAELTYTRRRDTVTITQCSSTAGDLVIPDEIAGCSRIKLSGRVFQRADELTSVTLSKNVVSVSSEIFDERHLGVKAIYVAEENARYCAKDGVLYSKDGKTLIVVPPGYPKRDFVVPEGVTTIGTGAFLCCGIHSVTLPNSLRTVRGYAFLLCAWLTSVHFPKGVSSAINETTFLGCKRLETITVDPENKTYCSKDGVLYSKDGKTLIVVPANYHTLDFVVPDGVETIGARAFRECAHIACVKLADSVKRLRHEAFYDCGRLESVRLSKSLRGLDAFVFNCCSRLHTLSIDAENPYYRAEDGIIYSKNGRKLVAVPPKYSKHSFEIPEGVTTLCRHALMCGYCTDIHTITFPKSLSEIRRCALLYGEMRHAVFRGDVPKGFSEIHLKWSRVHYPEAYASQWEAAIERAKSRDIFA